MEDGFDLCRELHENYVYPDFADVEKFCTTCESPVINNELVFAGLREDKQWLYDIKRKCPDYTKSYAEYRQDCRETMMMQMFFYIALFYHDKSSTSLLVLDFINLSRVYGEGIKNNAMHIIFQMSNPQNLKQITDNCDFYCNHPTLQYSTFFPFRIACCYQVENDMENARKYYELGLLRNGFDVTHSTMNHNFHRMTKCFTVAEFDDLILRYFDAGFTKCLADVKFLFKYDYRLWQILKRTTNKSAVIVAELERMKHLDLWKTTECPICYETECNLVPMNCGHYCCETCLPKMEGKCVYRCEQETRKML
jgi:hypothetical protein